MGLFGILIIVLILLMLLHRIILASMSAFPQSRGSAPISQIGFILSFGHCFGECRFGHVTEGPPVLRWRHRPRHR